MKVSKDSSVEFEAFPVGMHHAVCYSIVDLGHQEKTYKGDTKIVRQVFISFEVPAQRIEYEKDGQKMEGAKVIGKRYTASLSDKAILRKDLESWRGKAFSSEELEGFELSNLLGANCLLNVVHNEYNGKTYANISAITPLMDGQQKKSPENPTLSYEIGQPFPENMPKWLQEVVGKSKEYNQPTKEDEVPAHVRELQSQASEDDLPF